MASQIYAELDELKSYLNELTDTADDNTLTTCLYGGSRQIDGFTGRRFYLDDAPTARVVPTAHQTVNLPAGQLLLTGDMGSATGLVVEVWNGAEYTIVDPTTYELHPESDIDLGKPATALFKIGPAWSWHRKARITVRWGWPAIPDEVHQACLIQASRLYVRKDSPTGVMGSAEWGLVRMPHMDPDVRALLRPVCLPGIA